MKKIILSVLVALVSLSATSAPKQPKWVKSAKNSVVKIVSYKEGKEYNQGQGFICNGNTVYTDLTFMTGADSIVTIDGKGVSRSAQILTGANGMYEVAKFTINQEKKLTTLPLTSVAATVEQNVYILPYSTEKKIQPVETTVVNCVDIANGNKYYTLACHPDSSLFGCPVLDAGGGVIGIIQKCNTETDTCTYALDANFIDQIEIGAVSLVENAYKNIGIKKQLPEKIENALAYVFMMQQELSATEYGKLLDDYIKQFPNSADGYFNKGAFLINEADSTQHTYAVSLIEKSIELADSSVNEFLCDYANLIYNTITNGNNVSAENWNLNFALEQIEKAIAIKNSPIYQRVKGNILYSLERYQESYNCYKELNKSELASTETYLLAYTISHQLEIGFEEQIALLDSAIAKSGTPTPIYAAQYIQERALLNEKAGKNREAVVDLYRYEELLGSYNMNANFYYIREQLEIKAKMYELALKDIEHAITLEPDDIGFKLEQASMFVRVGDIDKALPLLQKLAEEEPEISDIHRLLGICYMRTDKTAAARKSLEKAKSLGDTLADQLLQQLD